MSFASVCYFAPAPFLRLICPRAAEAPGSPHAFLQLGDLDHLRVGNPLEHELGDAIADFDGEIRLGVVEEQHFYGPAVVCIYDAGARVNEVFACKAGAGGYAAVYFAGRERRRVWR